MAQKKKKKIKEKNIKRKEGNARLVHSGTWVGFSGLRALGSYSESFGMTLTANYTPNLKIGVPLYNKVAAEWSSLQAGRSLKDSPQVGPTPSMVYPPHILSF